MPRETKPLPPLSERPLVSIIVPSYNQGRFIRQTIDSIIAQTYRPIEILVMDGASTDQTLDVLRSYKDVPEFRLWSEPDQGVVDAVNKGFARAKGEIAAIQSSDDCYFPEAVALAVKALQDDPNTALVYGDVVRIDADDRELSRTNFGPFSLEALLAFQIYVPQPSAFFRMDAARSLGGWSEEFQYTPDTDLWIKLAFRWNVRKLDAVTAKLRKHEAQRDRRGERIIRDYCLMIDSSPDLHRASLRLRRAAAAGKLLLRNRYGYGDTAHAKLCRSWAAVFLFPPLLRQLNVGALLPGYFAFHRLTSNIKRRILRPPIRSFLVW